MSMNFFSLVSRKTMPVFLACGLLLSATTGQAQDAPQYTATISAATNPLSTRGVVTSPNYLASQAGLDVLRRGGTAVDAAIAAAMALTVVEPTGCGLGSDGFAIVWDGKELHGLNASGRSPAAWTPEYFEKLGGIPETGWNAVTVPGAVSAWVALSKRLGKLPFAQLAQPAIDYARNGFPVSPTIARLWALGAAKLGTQPGFAECFMPNGRVPKAGEIFRSEAHARTLELIAETEGEAFYRGVIAERIAAHAQANGGAMMSGFHALFSVGGFAGAACMALLLWGSWEQVVAGWSSYSTVLGYPLALGAAATLVLAIGMLLVVVRDMLRGTPTESSETSVE